MVCDSDIEGGQKMFVNGTACIAYSQCQGVTKAACTAYLIVVSQPCRHHFVVGYSVFDFGTYVCAWEGEGEGGQGVCGVSVRARASVRAPLNRLVVRFDPSLYTLINVYTINGCVRVFVLKGCVCVHCGYLWYLSCPSS